MFDSTYAAEEIAREVGVVLPEPPDGLEWGSGPEWSCLRAPAAASVRLICTVWLASKTSLGQKGLTASRDIPERSLRDLSSQNRVLADAALEVKAELEEGLARIGWCPIPVFPCLECGEDIPEEEELCTLCDIHPGKRISS